MVKSARSLLIMNILTTLTPAKTGLCPMRPLSHAMTSLLVQLCHLRSSLPSVYLGRCRTVVEEKVGEVVECQGMW
ncbi:hypothetical protein E2C01_030778 [Portunus trituberculatus]|uniref:Secreted protein n=1 Tax=Portunus trituberculatus TaxID=210409 RepID=A0A5B7EYA8_PORTR|nr:hypothetical protein [Portunus trituberculatus]